MPKTAMNIKKRPTDCSIASHGNMLTKKQYQRAPNCKKINHGRNMAPSNQIMTNNIARGAPRERHISWKTNFTSRPRTVLHTAARSVPLRSSKQLYSPIVVPKKMKLNHHTDLKKQESSNPYASITMTISNTEIEDNHYKLPCSPVTDKDFETAIALLSDSVLPSFSTPASLEKVSSNH